MPNGTHINRQPFYFIKGSKTMQFVSKKDILIISYMNSLLRNKGQRSKRKTQELKIMVFLYLKRKLSLLGFSINLSRIKEYRRLLFSSSFSMSLCTDILQRHPRRSCSILFLKHVFILLFKQEKTVSTDEEEIATVAFSKRSLKTSERQDCRLSWLM